MKRILVLQLKRIGDTVLTAPALASLRRAEPGARVTLVLAGACGELGDLLPVDEVLVWWPGRLNARVLLQVASGGWDAVLDFTGSDRSAVLAWLSRAPLRVGWEKFAVNSLRRRAWNVRSGAIVRELHTVDFHRALVHAAFPGAPDPGDCGHLRSAVGPELPELPSRYVLFHPGTAREEKFWLAEHWGAMLERVGGTLGWPVVVTGGRDPREEQAVRAMRATGVAFTDLSGRLNLRQLAAVVQGCRLAVTVDTGVMHLAAAWGRPQVALFGPTNPWHWAPRHGLARVLQGPDGEGRRSPKQSGEAMAALSVERVCGAVDDLLRREDGDPTLNRISP
jgi:ADP-heptose:LPS heptosyltransferase